MTSVAVLLHLKYCFPAGTPLLTTDGSKRIENFKIGDQILSRSEHDPDGPLEVKTVEAVFTRSSQLISLLVGGQQIRTTAEHPFYVAGKGWTPANKIAIGESLLSHDGSEAVVEAIGGTDEFETVYNLQVADYHTYFVGKADWAFSVWAHNAGNLVHVPIVVLPDGWVWIDGHFGVRTIDEANKIAMRVASGGGGLDSTRVRTIVPGARVQFTNGWYTVQGNPFLGDTYTIGINARIAAPPNFPTILDTELLEIQAQWMTSQITRGSRSTGIQDESVRELLKSMIRDRPLYPRLNSREFLDGLGVGNASELGMTRKQLETALKPSLAQRAMWEVVDELASRHPTGSIKVIIGANSPLSPLPDTGRGGGAGEFLIVRNQAMRVQVTGGDQAFERMLHVARQITGRPC